MISAFIKKGFTKHSLGFRLFAFSPFNVFDSGQTQPIRLRIYNGDQQIEEPQWFSYAYAAVAVKTSTLVVSALVRNIRPIANSAVKPPM
jgi:hypothetical protein